MAEKPSQSAARPLVLASTSRYRRVLLQRLGIAFEIAGPATDETRLVDEPPHATAARLALAKARVVAVRHPQAIVIGSDQVCALGQTAVGKPGSVDENRLMIGQLSGQTAVFHTAVAVIGIEAGVWKQHVDQTHCVFRELSPAEIDDYVEREPCLDCAGGFKVEGLGISLFQRIESLDPTALIGLPLIWLAGALRESGLRS